ncbi:uncharacterized protein LOC115719596 [Cannabis sativa]|uniref:uncharacterized protein LOC115719596 n=1 Tax=Cannabis sativa TaxID=3483 RepID=UPI0011DF5A88|nr:uncharacterized protein LOC115719596 [Cannabis sativa]
MTSYFQEAENHGAVIDQTTQKGGAKTPSSSTFNGMAKAEANIASTSKPSKKKNWKNSKKPLKAMKIVKKKKAANPDAKKKGKCFYCNEKDHWKPKCPKFLAKKQALAA